MEEKSLDIFGRSLSVNASTKCLVTLLCSRGEERKEDKC